jgi:deoxycytidine triphosphate deaminase
MSEPAAEWAIDVPDDVPTTEHQAEERYQHTRDRDPFPDVAPALLNSADVYDYVRATGMIWPFDPDRLKAASYKVSIGNRFIYWDGDEQEHALELEERQKFHLEPNSIGFVTTKEVFRLPHYIAARFNLRISNVHRGILLGTGPLVDPGFVGRLLVPLHNLTANRYPFYEGDEFAWFEFTKVSPNYWDQEYMNRRREGRFRGEYKEFPRIKLELSSGEYLSKAWPGPIPSSIPSAIAEYKRFAEDSRTAAVNAERTLRRIAWIATIGVIVGTLGVVVPSLLASWQLVGGVKDSVADLRERLNASNQELGRLADTIKRAPDEQRSETGPLLRRLTAEVDALQNALGGFDPAAIQTELGELHGSVSRLESELNALRQQPVQR